MRKRDRNAAMRSRIDSLRDQRNRGGAETVMHWIQSHVQDETKRTRVTTMIQCACREASGREECTEEGEDHHWLHNGNNRADELANKTKEMDKQTKISVADDCVAITLYEFIFVPV